MKINGKHLLIMLVFIVTIFGIAIYAISCYPGMTEVVHSMISGESLPTEEVTEPSTEPEVTEPSTEATEPATEETEPTVPVETEPTEPPAAEPEATEPTVTEPEPTEPPAEDPEATEPEETAPSDPPAPEETVDNNPQPSEGANAGLLSGIDWSTTTYVGPADPETGISWDGQSPIVYTYADGTTGTEPVVGATYERVPGVIMVYEIHDSSLSEEDIGDNVTYCHKCGKQRGDGTKGTCISWYLVGGEHACPSCGETVPEYTCHSCKE